MIKKIALNILKCVRSIKWSFEGAIIRLFSIKRNHEITLPGKTFVFVPHSDDETLGAYSLLVNGKADVTLLYFGYTGSNCSSANKSVRDKEFFNFCDYHNLKYINVNEQSDFVELIKNQGTTVNLVFPSIFDWHKEHRKINSVVSKTLSKIADASYCNLYWYSITIPLVDNNVVFCGGNKQMFTDKYNDFDYYYQSQHHLPKKRFAIQNRINGKCFGTYFAENFLKITIKDLFYSEKLEREKEPELNSLRKHINSIFLIRKKSKEFYKKFQIRNGEKQNETL